MVVASLQLFNESDIENEGREITAFQLLELSRSLRKKLSIVAENMQILEDLGEHFVLNKFSVDVELKLDSIKESKESKSKTKSKSKAYSYISMVDGEIKVHKTWEECKARVNGVSGARYKKSTSPSDEAEIIKEFTE